nr:hypothetical protein [Tanacetum cinerariifolium]
MSGEFFRGTTGDQDTRFLNKHAKLLKSQKFHTELENLVDMTKVNMDVMRPWIAKLLGSKDEVLINFIYGLQEENLENASGIPQQFLDAKEEESRKKQEDRDRITTELKRAKEKEGEGHVLPFNKGHVLPFDGGHVPPLDDGHDPSSAEGLNLYWSKVAIPYPADNVFSHLAEIAFPQPAKVVAHVTSLSWKQHLKEISLEQLCDIHDRAYMHQAVLDNDKAAVVSKVVPEAAMKLIQSDEMGILVAKFVKASMFHGRCSTFEEVDNLKEYFVLEKMPGYRPSSKEEFDRASADWLMLPIPSWLS